MSPTYTKNTTSIVCGLPAQRMTIEAHLETLDIATWSDPLATLPGRSWYEVHFEFLLLSNKELELAQLRFPVGDGTSFNAHDLGPADVCQYCGTAWLPGTLTCPSCGGQTYLHKRAIEYATRNPGRIMQTRLDMPFDGIASFTVDVEFSELQWPAGTWTTMFQHSLWSTDPALWVCSYCGHMVHGYTASCPGCGGKRLPIDVLATQERECLYCGRHMVGGYACPRCNMRLLAREKPLARWTL